MPAGYRNDACKVSLKRTLPNSRWRFYSQTSAAECIFLWADDFYTFSRCARNVENAYVLTWFYEKHRKKHRRIATFVKPFGVAIGSPGRKPKKTRRETARRKALFCDAARDANGPWI